MFRKIKLRFLLALPSDYQTLAYRMLFRKGDLTRLDFDDMVLVGTENVMKLWEFTAWAERHHKN